MTFEERDTLALKRVEQMLYEAALAALSENLDLVVDTYMRAIRDPDPLVVLKAIEQLENRALGKPIQPIVYEITHKGANGNPASVYDFPRRQQGDEAEASK